MKIQLARVGSVSLWVKTEWPNKQLSLYVWMESTLSGQPRELGFLLQAEDLASFKANVQTLLKNLK